MVVTESRLHFRTVQSTLATELSKYLDLAKEELNCTWGLYMPKANGKKKTARRDPDSHDV